MRWREGRCSPSPTPPRSDENGQGRALPAWFGRKPGKGATTCWEKLPPINELAETLRAADRPPLVRMEAPKGLLYNVTQQAKEGRLMVHLLNYLPQPVDKVVVTIGGKYDQVTLLTPDSQGDQPRIVRRDETVTEIEVPRVKIYSLLMLSHNR